RTGDCRRTYIDDFQFGYCAQQQTAMAKRRNADLFKVLITQIRQDDKANIILGKSLSVLPETKLPQPVGNLLHWRPPCGFDALRFGPAGKPITCVKLVDVPLTADQTHRRQGSGVANMGGHWAGHAPTRACRCNRAMQLPGSTKFARLFAGRAATRL